MKAFKHLELGKNIINGLEGGDLRSYRNGLFLSFSEEIDKTQFLQKYLIPECLEHDWYPIYINLKTEKIQTGDPIKPSIYVEINKNSSNKHTHFEENTLSGLLKDLHKLTGKLLVLIIDEALCTQYTESGISSMYALKSALEHLTINSDGLRIVFANDNNPDFSRLVRNVNEAFYCSKILDIP